LNIFSTSFVADLSDINPNPNRHGPRIRRRATSNLLERPLGVIHLPVPPGPFVPQGILPISRPFGQEILLQASGGWTASHGHGSPTGHPRAQEQADHSGRRQHLRDHGANSRTDVGRIMGRNRLDPDHTFGLPTPSSGPTFTIPDITYRRILGEWEMSIILARWRVRSSSTRHSRSHRILYRILVVIFPSTAIWVLSSGCRTERWEGPGVSSKVGYVSCLFSPRPCPSEPSRGRSSSSLGAGLGVCGLVS
jgi:hypothetical protein